MAESNKIVTPILKWVGGKRQLMPTIVDLLPKNINELTYVEPFIGGGAVLFHLQPQNAIANDFNPELVNVYKVIKDELPELIADLKNHENNAEYFYRIRGLDRTSEFAQLTAVQKASRVIYLNKTCFNGLYRVNSSGEFNTPFGRYKNPNIVNESALSAVHNYLNTNNVLLRNDDYADVLADIKEDSFVYLDPPYHPISESSSFTGYVKGGWGSLDQIRLREVCDQLHSRGVKFLLSNSSAPLIKEEYKNYDIITVKANRAINSKGSDRGEIDEVLIRNYNN